MRPFILCIGFVAFYSVMQPARVSAQIEVPPISPHTVLPLTVVVELAGFIWTGSGSG